MKKWYSLFISIYGSISLKVYNFIKIPGEIKKSPFLDS